MVDLGRALTYFPTSLECSPSTLMLTTYLYWALDADWAEIAKPRPIRPTKVNEFSSIFSQRDKSF